MCHVQYQVVTKKVSSFGIKNLGYTVVYSVFVSKKTFHMDCIYKGLYICPMIWRELDNFSPNAVCLVLASEPYDEFDYYRDYDEFLGVVKVLPK